MRVLFVFPDQSSTVTNYTGAVHYGVAQLSATLRAAGHEPRLFHLVDPIGEEAFRERVRAERPDLVAFSSISHYARRLREWTTWAHEASGAPVAIGGVHATFAPDEVSAHPDVSFTCIGEGDGALLDLCETLERGGDPSGIAGLWVRWRGALVKNPPRTIVDDLDRLPDPDLGLFDFANLYTSRLGTFTFLMSRGCNFRCTYCSAHTLRRVAPASGKFWRFLSPARAVEQLARLQARHLPGARNVSFTDAILFPNQAWLAEFAPLYRKHVGLPISCNMRADMIDEASADLLYEAGVRIVRLGVESGNPHMTRDVLRRHLDVADIRRAYALLRERGIERWSYNMVGLPTETLPMALETVRLNAEIDPELAIPFIFYPYPGTDLHRLCRERGFLTDREFDTYKVGVTLRQPQFRDGDILFIHRNFHRLIRLYRRAGRLPGGLGRVAPDLLDRALASPLVPRAAIVGASEGYRRLRHAVGEYLVRRAPGLYRRLGGRAPGPAPVAARAPREGLARADAS